MHALGCPQFAKKLASITWRHWHLLGIDEIKNGDLTIPEQPAAWREKTLTICRDNLLENIGMEISAGQYRLRGG
ncbi:unnamed protein product [Rodentolepis nana]|uniref:Malate transporter n=1 Tax=Rodentolepis nana TaxID=102285 RepID=A0A0R3TQ78_RODNA|nr:unnamed protein product [Rodentolepis nana]